MTSTSVPDTRPILVGKMTLPRLLELTDSRSLLGDGKALRSRLDKDGYLFIRGLHDREKVLAARKAITDYMAEHGDRLAPGTDPGQAIIRPGGKGPGLIGNKAVTHHPAVRSVLEGEPVFALFESLFSEEARTFDYKWLREVGAGGFTGVHVDNVYMGRGSRKLLTCWTPFGDIPMELGTLTVIPGSNHHPAFAPIRETYGRMDTDRDRIEGWFTSDPLEITEKFGGEWHSADMRAGDVVILSMFTLHGSTTNTTDRFRLSCDTRFQPASEPADPRWVGENPSAHEKSDRPMTSMSVARAQWGV